MKESPVKPGDVLADKYLVESVIGVGGMGVVVEAIHLELHESRAIKLMLPEAMEERDAEERFMREARASSKLKSEYVARVHDVGRLDNGLPYMVMEYLEGQDLRHLLKERGRLPPPEAVHYVLQVCEALAEAHANGIVHRDLKPGNLFLTIRADGSPCIKVLDFGISKQLGAGDWEMTKTQAVLGSPSYMSPEQMRSARTVDARTDIWSLGVILYRLTTGELPFKGETITELVSKVLQSPVRPPSTVAPDLPKDLDAILLRCLSRDLSERFANVGELSAALLPFAPAEARASVERIARVLASASHGGALPASRATPKSSSIPSRSGSSGDAWVNTSFGTGTVSVHLWKLWALIAACGALGIGGVVSIVVAKRASVDVVTVAPKPPPQPGASDVTPANLPVAAAPAPAETPKPVVPAANPATTAVASAPPEVPQPVAVVAKAGPLPGWRPSSSKPTAATAQPEPAKPAAPPSAAPAPPATAPPATTASHRVFGTEN